MEANYSVALCAALAEFRTVLFTSQIIVLTQNGRREQVYHTKITISSRIISSPGISSIYPPLLLA